MSKAIPFSAIVTGVAGLKDKSLKITLSTQEVNPDTAGKLFALHTQFTACLISPVKIEKEDIKLMRNVSPTIPDEPKTQSQRLRGVLYRIWEQDKAGVDFEEFYRLQMEVVINHFKTKLQP